MAIGHQNTAFVMFSGRQIDEWIEWIPKGNAKPTQDRLLTVDNERLVGRVQKDENDFKGFWRAS